MRYGRELVETLCEVGGHEGGAMFCIECKRRVASAVVDSMIEGRYGDEDMGAIAMPAGYAPSKVPGTLRLPVGDRCICGDLRSECLIDLIWRTGRR